MQRLKWFCRRRATLGTIAVTLLWIGASVTEAQDPSESAQSPQDAAPPAAAKRGLLRNEPGSLEGYTLIAPMRGNKTYLIDMEGRVVRTWESKYTPALCAYLLENGNLLRPAALEGDESFFRRGPGAGG